MKRMGERLRWVREAFGEQSQQAIADKVGVHQTLWSMYERGKRAPDQFNAVRIIAKLGISREYLLEGKLDGVERNLAIRLAAKHPELAGLTNKEPGTGTDLS
jgi:transcriptional regulator with XRE-family HTH domain